MLRLTRHQHSTDQPYAVIDEQEPQVGGVPAPATTVFLTASECPIGCSMCDLWQNTVESPTPQGAIPRQLSRAIERRTQRGILKLYNSGNFFDRRSIPISDYPAIASLAAPYERVVVENHPSFPKSLALQFRDLLSGRLEVAVGLETVQPRWLGRMKKRMTRDDFDRYAEFLREADLDLRVFLIVGVPGIDAVEAIRWAMLSVRHAIAAGARHISLIPARQGHGWNGRANELPAFHLEALAGLALDAIRDARGRAVITVDLWDLDTAATAGQRLRHINLCQEDL